MRFRGTSNHAVSEPSTTKRQLSPWTKLGSIALEDDRRLWLGDPALATAADEGVVIQIQDANVDVYYESVDFGGDVRVSRVRICSDGQLEADPVSVLGTVWTDTAMITAVSPAASEALDTHRARGTLDEVLSGVDLVGRVNLHEPALNLLVVSSGFGDGEYPLTASIGNKGTLLEVVFISQSEPYAFDR